MVSAIVKHKRIEMSILSLSTHRLTLSFPRDSCLCFGVEECRQVWCGLPSAYVAFVLDADPTKIRWTSIVTLADVETPSHSSRLVDAGSWANKKLKPCCVIKTQHPVGSLCTCRMSSPELSCPWLFDKQKHLYFYQGVLPKNAEVG